MGGVRGRLPMLRRIAGFAYVSLFAVLAVVFAVVWSVRFANGEAPSPQLFWAAVGCTFVVLASVDAMMRDGEA